MAFQPINFIAVRPQGNSFLRDFVDNLAQGYQTGQMPFALERQKQKENLANAMLQLQYQQEPQRFKSEMLGRSLANQLKQLQLQEEPENLKMARALQEAQLNKLQQEANLPFGGKIAPGSIGQAMWLEMIKNQYGEESPIYQNAKRGYESDLSQSNILNQYRTALTNSVSYRNLPADEKKRVISTAVGMGYDPTEAANKLAAGQDLTQLASQKGINLEDVTPNYPLSGQLITQAKNRKAFSDEIFNLEKNISKPLIEGGRRFIGFSPTQIISAIKNNNPEEQGRILAARALQPELAALRTKAAGGQVGIEAIRELQSSALGNMKVFESLISPEARGYMNQYISQWLGEAVNTYNNSIQESAKLGTSSKNETFSKDVMIYNPETGLLE